MKKDGITLLELLIVFAIIAILARVMTPMLKRNTFAAREARVMYDFDAIKAAARSLFFDIEEWPSAGDQGDGLVNTIGITNTDDWDGPYLRDWRDDPWGNPYVIIQPSANDPQWVSSSGPDENLSTSDDLILLIHP